MLTRAGTLIAAALASLALIAPTAAAAGLADHVHVFAGTRPGHDTFGGGHNFPGAAAPFGMVQWSPDTTPADRNGRAGYDYRDSHIKGFGITHLSGAGCSLYGDFPFLPTTEPIDASPAAEGASLDGRFQPGFSHGEESGRPGYYSVRLNPVRGGAIETELTATTRTGMARFTFPRNPHASVLINAGGSAQPDDFAAVNIDPANREIDGTASSGLFCGQRPRYRVYIAAVFNRGFSAYGTWEEDKLNPGETAASDSQAPPTNPKTSADAGAYASFDTRHNRTVTARVGVSFVSVEDARANLAAENPGHGFSAVARETEGRWNSWLGQIRVRGGPPRLLDTFYTALYHVGLAPRTFSDVGGAYIGMDGLLHRAEGRTQYADFSGWDTYRTQIQLLSILAPKRASEMVRSLLADAAESGCLPRWPYANGQSMTMVGDSADPLIASAAAFGAQAFDRGAALAAMLRGADGECRSANGEYLERQGLAPYLAHGYVPFDLDTNDRNANSIYGSPDDVWGSAATSLEYTVDDFAIAQFAARELGDGGSYRRFMQRSGNWRKLFDRHSKMIEPRYENGAFPANYDNLGGGGFVEGDSAQYSWAVPHDPAGLFRLMGGRGKAAKRLGRFLRKLNAGPGGTHVDHALLGNEPTLQVPWLYDWLRRPYGTQAAVRRGLRLYSPSPSGYPGNDDLGTLSAWYVFGALGLYPEVPGVGVLAVGSPLFGHASVALANGRRLTIAATARETRGKGKKKHTTALSPSRAPYISALRINDHRTSKPWTTWCALSRGANLAFELSPHPNRKWGSSAAAAPPSFGPGRAMPKDACTP
ncbi:MAG TPA: GH92 family glycosyl hydrolase [Solirubrobacterales bacterium]|nr:GH92 family glycosyl hydrolase [Solirubrobacterales bacterium]